MNVKFLMYCSKPQVINFKNKYYVTHDTVNTPLPSIINVKICSEHTNVSFIEKKILTFKLIIWKAEN
jgi:hypothetical protein